MEKLQEIASPIRDLRADLGLNQRDFSRLINKSQAFLSDLENACVTMPDDVVARLTELGADGETMRQEHNAAMKRRDSAIEQAVIAKLKKNQ